MTTSTQLACAVAWLNRFLLQAVLSSMKTTTPPTLPAAHADFALSGTFQNSTGEDERG
jgi:hypothetical protein